MPLEAGFGYFRTGGEIAMTILPPVIKLHVANLPLPNIQYS